ncbi:putative uncharacterized protein [Prevotella sp. CAG:617]|nr:putative uncharacterized protein [Prevotella sp. CAG:617]
MKINDLPSVNGYYEWEDQYATLTDHYPNYDARPVIGITGNFGDKGCELAEGYFSCIEAAGGVPLVIPVLTETSALMQILNRIDGLMLSGGGDLNPLLLEQDPSPRLHGVNPRRDSMELLLTRLAYDRQLPILGICRGLQVMTVALGGTVMQDISESMPGVKLVKHDQNMPRGFASHTVTAAKDSLVGRLFGTRFAVNSFHHQAVEHPGQALHVTARASDGVVEAVESTEFKPIVGVQWHPECFLQERDERMMPLFEWFVQQAGAFSRARRLHRRILTLDSHCDTPMFFEQGVHFDHRDPTVLVDLHKMTEGHLDATIMVAYLKQMERHPEDLQAAIAKANDLLDQIRAMVESCRPWAEIAYTPADLYRIKAAGHKAIMLGIENGYAIGADLTRVEHFRRKGVVYMTLCHNGDNDICDSACRSNREHGGLSDFGREVIQEMNRTGMMVDLSHASEESFYDALEESHTPIVCSHASSRALCDHPRNLTDRQLQALAECGGVAQMTLYHGFLSLDEGATIEDAVRHLMHMISVAGIDHVGIGTDFDGDGGVPGCANASELINLTRMLQAEGLTEQDLRKVWGANFLRVMQQCQAASEIIL